MSAEPYEIDVGGKKKKKKKVEYCHFHVFNLRYSSLLSTIAECQEQANINDFSNKLLFACSSLNFIKKMLAGS